MLRLKARSDEHQNRYQYTSLLLLFASSSAFKRNLHATGMAVLFWMTAAICVGVVLRSSSKTYTRARDGVGILITSCSIIRM